MSRFDTILEKYRKESTSLRDQGFRFEKFIQKYLLVDPLYSNVLESVWLWSEWPFRGKSVDTGIDLVAQEKDTGNLWAIQCKFYGDNSTISKEDIDSFLSASGKSYEVNGTHIFFTRRVLFSSVDSWTKNAEDTIKNQAIPVTRIRVSDIRNAPVDWDRFDPDDISSLVIAAPFELREHQIEAFHAVLDGFEKSPRGKLIMACGTGKTFTSLRIAEAISSGNANMLFLVPSISLLSQSLREWSSEISTDCHFIAICSDPKASKTSLREDISSVDVILPASTNEKTIEFQYRTYRAKGGNVLFFSTYQSIEVVSRIQKKLGFVFDLVICDEAHRTTGVTLSGENESYFVRVHDDNYIKAEKRLYMTATPRVYGDESKNKAQEKDAILASMDDEQIYGPEFYNLSFSKAVGQNILSDYRVIVLAVDEKYVSRSLQRMLVNSDSELNLEDAVKIIGCWNGLSKKGKYSSNPGTVEESFFVDPYPMRRAVAFSNRIKDSKRIAALFTGVVEEYLSSHKDSDLIQVETDHVDGTFNALVRNKKIDWLKAGGADDTCRILSNARCLSEGVDVPSLDAVLFLNPRNSIVDIIQSVGRVMRKTEGKKYGYIILPIGIPSDKTPEVALKDNEKYKIVWDVLQALRSHDDRFNNTINKINFNKTRPEQISVIGVTGGEKDGGEIAEQISFHFDEEFFKEWENAIYARIVEKVGSKIYWETWAKDVAQIAQRHIDRIQSLLSSANKKYVTEFSNFLGNLRINLNPSITEEDAIEMLSEHMITEPVFDALFGDYSFFKHNPVSIAMDKMLSIFDNLGFDKETEKLDSFYGNVRKRVSGINSYEGKQKIIIELYEKFFKVALPKQVESLGIVYTPVEVVDFIINSVEYAVNRHFGASISDQGVHVLDPFVGTGTFIVRLIQSNLIEKSKLQYKYSNELHANEIVLLAYYIGLVNIEQAFHERMKQDEYSQFPGIVLADTFHMTEDPYSDNPYSVSTFHPVFPENSARAEAQLGFDIRVIIGNPPYSIGQSSANDNNQNLSYPKLDQAILESYSQNSNAQQKKGIYDSYIRAFRWATDRIKEKGIICFVSNGAFIDNTGMDGFRKCMLDEFSSIYCFNLRGNARLQGEQRRKERGNVFGGGSRTSIAITLLVKDPSSEPDGYIHYYDIGDYLSREEKLATIKKFGDISQIDWEEILPDEHNDWINVRNDEFDSYFAIGDKSKSKEITFFQPIYSTGLFTSRNAWTYNFSKGEVETNATRLIEAFNSEIDRCRLLLKNDSSIILDEVKNLDPSYMNWSEKLNRRFSNLDKIEKNDNSIRITMFRPFCKMWLCFNDPIIERPSTWPLIFPEANTKNLVISTSGKATTKDFSVLITDTIQDLHLNVNSQCFPLYYYEPSNTLDLFGEAEDGYYKRDGITDAILIEFQKQLKKTVTKEDIFYYVYGILHAPDYRDKFQNDLKKVLARIPVSTEFETISRIGRELASLHLNYETGPLFCEAVLDIAQEEYSVEKMRFGDDVTTIIYNDFISIKGIPLEAYNYVLGGKPAIEWIMDRYQVTVDSESHIKNDPNLYQGGKYIFDLLLRIIQLSLMTLELVGQLPKTID